MITQTLTVPRRFYEELHSVAYGAFAQRRSIVNEEAWTSLPDKIKRVYGPVSRREVADPTLFTSFIVMMAQRVQNPRDPFIDPPVQAGFDLAVNLGIRINAENSAHVIVDYFWGQAGEELPGAWGIYPIPPDPGASAATERRHTTSARTRLREAMDAADRRADEARVIRNLGVQINNVGLAADSVASSSEAFRQALQGISMAARNIGRNEPSRRREEPVLEYIGPSENQMGFQIQIPRYEMEHLRLLHDARPSGRLVETHERILAAIPSIDREMLRIMLVRYPSELSQIAEEMYIPPPSLGTGVAQRYGPQFFEDRDIPTDSIRFQFRWCRQQSYPVGTGPLAGHYVTATPSFPGYDDSLFRGMDFAEPGTRDRTASVQSRTVAPVTPAKRESRRLNIRPKTQEVTQNEPHDQHQGDQDPIHRRFALRARRNARQGDQHHPDRER